MSSHPFSAAPARGLAAGPVGSHGIFGDRAPGTAPGTAPGAGPYASPYDNFQVPFSATPAARTPVLESAIEGVRRSLNQQRTPLFDAFFAPENIDLVQNRLRATILQKSGYAIDRQSDTDLVVLMRGVWVEAADVGAPVAQEVARLNELVLFQVVPMVASGVLGYLTYLRDASSLPQPLPRGQQTSLKGTKTFELFRGL